MNQNIDGPDGRLRLGNYRLTFPSGRQFFLIVLLSVAVYGIVTYLMWPDITHLANQLKTDLPPGTSLTKIEHYFTDRHIDYGFDEQHNRVKAQVLRIKGTFPPVEKNVEITISLDKEHNLTGIWFEPYYTGP